MAQQTRDQLKQWFETGDYPTQQQFWDWIDSFILNTDSIPLATINGLVDILNNKQDKITPHVILLQPGTASWNVPAGTLVEKIWFQLTTTTNISVGTSLGADDVYEQGGPDSQGNIFFAGDKPFREAATLYFNGIQNDTLTIIYTR